MTPEAIARVKRSYAALPAAGRQLSGRFYEALFTAEPALRARFPSDLTTLQGHFEAALAIIVRNLNDVGTLQEALGVLGGVDVDWGGGPVY
jgi:hypothetical protein